MAPPWVSTVLLVLGTVAVLGAIVATPLCVEVPTMSLEEHKAVLMDIYKRFAAACKEYDVQFWGSFGTHLGATRHAGIIPWDDDLDLGVFSEGRQVLVDHETEITEKYGITLTGDWKWNLVGTLKVQLQDGGGRAFIDVFPMDVQDGNTRLTSSFMRHVNPTCYYPGNLRATGLKDVPFEDTTIPVPRDNAFLDLCYGEDWRTPKRRAAHFYTVDGQVPILVWAPVVVGVSIGLLGLLLIALGIWRFRLDRSP